MPATISVPPQQLLERILTLEIVRVTERAAVSPARLRGYGNKVAADQGAVDAMRRELNKMPINGTVVIGEGSIRRRCSSSAKRLVKTMDRKSISRSATGVTNGALVSGVKFHKHFIETETIVMRSVTGTVRIIRGQHRQLEKFHLD